MAIMKIHRGAARGFAAAALGAAVMAGAFMPASAAEQFWVYLRGSDPRPQGSWDVTLQDIVRTGKAGGDYTSHDVRVSSEYGITNKLTLRGTIAFSNHDYAIDDPALQPYYSTQGGEGGRVSRTDFAGYEVGTTYNLMSNYGDEPFGLSVGAGVGKYRRARLDGAPVEQDEVKLDAVAQKNFFDNTLVFAVNPQLTLEKRRFRPGDASSLGADAREEEVSLAVSAGASYRFAKGWFAGLEYRHQSDFFTPSRGGALATEGNAGLWPSDADLLPEFGDRFHNGDYLGPTLHYGSAKWWATAGALFQVNGGGADGAFGSGGRNYSGNEDVHASVAVGFNF